MLILTEKPGVAAEFAAVLGCTKKQGYFESADTCIVWAVGHLLELREPSDYDPKYQKWNLDDLPILPERMRYKPIESTADRLKAIKGCFDKWGNTGLLLATDAEREGELIGETILHYVKFGDYEKAKRFWVSEALTPEVIKKGMASARPLKEYDTYKNEGYARQHADWLVGMNLSRLVALRCNAKLTAGRVQTAVLAAIYGREKAIAEFKKEYYYQLALTLKKEAAVFTLYLTRQEGTEGINRFSESDPYLLEAHRACKDADSAAIEKAAKTKKEIPPPQLYNLTGLQKDANKRFGYSPAATLEIAQRLYETYKCLSYPRTPSKVLGDDNVTLFREKYELLKAAYPEEAADTHEEYLSGGNKRLFNTDELRDHHALIPLAALPESAGEAETNVYRLVLERFFTILKPPYVYESIAVSAIAGGYTFTGTGKQILAMGWKAGTNRDDDKEEEEDFPELSRGEIVPVDKIEKLQKETKPKGHYTEATLLQLMENPRGEDNGKLAGLGTPATRASIIKALFDRGYIGLDKKNILITDKGRFLIENMGQNKYLSRFLSIRETTDWEQKLSDNPKAFLNEIVDYLKIAIPAVTADKAVRQWEQEGIGKCPVCGKGVLAGKTNYYCGGYKEGCTFVIWQKICGASVTAKDTALLLGGKQTGKKTFTKKDGKTFTAKLELRGKDVAFVFDEPGPKRGK